MAHQAVFHSRWSQILKKSDFRIIVFIEITVGGLISVIQYATSLLRLQQFIRVVRGGCPGLQNTVLQF
jgi:hypothetical protein